MHSSKLNKKRRDILHELIAVGAIQLVYLKSFEICEKFVS